MRQTSKETGTRPSVLLCISDPLVAYQVDACVTTFGITIENALLERNETGVGQHRRSEPKYTLTQLLDPAFRLPRPMTEKQKAKQGIQGLLAMAGQRGSGVKKWKTVD